MGVYIKDMKKPTDCKYCVMYRDGYCGAKGGFCRSEKGIDEDCPLIEVKAEEEDVWETIENEMDALTYFNKW